MKLFDILDFTITNTIDTPLLVAFLYYVHRLVRGTVAISTFTGIVMVYLPWRIVETSQMQLPSSILGQFAGVGVFALIVVFQQKVRHPLLAIGFTNITARNKLHRIFYFFRQKESLLDTEGLVNVCHKLGTIHTGALTVIERSMPLNFVIATSGRMNLELSGSVTESIFYKNSPLHDGAIAVRDNTAVATWVILPVAAEDTLFRHYGLRHRAAIPITEKTDVIALVVSEETGYISYFKNDNFVRFADEEEFTKMIQEDN